MLWSSNHSVCTSNHFRRWNDPDHLLHANKYVILFIFVSDYLSISKYHSASASGTECDTENAIDYTDTSLTTYPDVESTRLPITFPASEYVVVTVTFGKSLNIKEFLVVGDNIRGVSFATKDEDGNPIDTFDAMADSQVSIAF